MIKTEIAHKMAELVQQKDVLESKKTIVVKKYNDDIKGVEAQISEMAQKYLNVEQDDLFDNVQESEIEEAEVIETKLLEDKKYLLPEATNVEQS